MKVEYINPFIASTTAAFSTMLGVEVIRGDISIKQGCQPRHEINGIIGLSGKAVGVVALSVGRDVAFGVTEKMLGERPAEIDANVTDAIGEMANIVAGGAKAHLDKYELRVSLPTVVVGKSHFIEFPSKVTPISIPFDSQWGPLVIEVGLVEEVETLSVQPCSVPG